MSKSDLLPIEDRVQRALQQNFPEQGNLTFVIGVSGGPDSMCLLYIFKRLGVNALVVHVNYGKRGRESDKDAELVEQMAFQWGFECQSVRVNPAESAGENFQDWARSVRYDIFRSLNSEYQTNGIAVAHNEDDQIETILQKQFRGAGLSGWTGMRVWDGEIFRPLLETSRDEIMAYVDQQCIPFRMDQSNMESKFARNFLRNEWKEGLIERFPGWRQNVLRIATQADLFDEAVEWISSRIIDKKSRINRQELLNLSNSLRKALVLHQLKKMDPGLAISRSALDELNEVHTLQTGKAVQLAGHLSLIRDRDYFQMVRDPKYIQNKIVIARDQLMTQSLSLGGIEVSIEPFAGPDFQRHLYMDADKLAWPLCLREWNNGDRFQPFGMQGHQMVSDHLTNRKISTVEKKNALVLETFDENVCAVIFPPNENRVPPGTISDPVRCDKQTRRCLTIKRSH